MKKKKNRQRAAGDGLVDLGTAALGGAAGITVLNHSGVVEAFLATGVPGVVGVVVLGVAALGFGYLRARLDQDDD